MAGFRGTNPQRHPWFVQDIEAPVLPPECKVTYASDLPEEFQTEYQREEVTDGDVEDDS